MGITLRYWFLGTASDGLCNAWSKALYDVLNQRYVRRRTEVGSSFAWLESWFKTLPGTFCIERCKSRHLLAREEGEIELLLTCVLGQD